MTAVQPLVAQMRAPVRAERDQPRHLARRRVDREPRRDALVDRLLLLRKQQHPKRLGGIALDHQRLLRLGGRDRVHERDRPQDEWLVRPVEERIHRRHQRGRRAPVPLEVAHGLRLFARAHVGEHVGATKRVDRLLGIADEEDSARPSRRRCAGHDLVLERVRVLEFVDRAPRRTERGGVGERPAVTRLGERVARAPLPGRRKCWTPRSRSAAELRRREPDRARAQRLHPCVVRGPRAAVALA